MSTQQRVQRVREEIKKEAAEILRAMRDPRIGFVTITDVEVSSDLRHVKIFVSVLGTEEEKKRCLDALQSAAGFVRTEIGKVIRLRHTPEIAFRLDDSIERGVRINQLLSQIAQENASDASTASFAPTVEEDE